MYFFIHLDDYATQEMLKSFSPCQFVCLKNLQLSNNSIIQGYNRIRTIESIAFIDMPII